MNTMERLLEEEKSIIIEEKKLERLIEENDSLIHNFLIETKLDKEKYKVIMNEPFMEYNFLRLAQEFLMVIDKNIPNCGRAVKGSMLFDLYDKVFIELFVPINNSLNAFKDALTQERLYGTKVTLEVKDVNDVMQKLKINPDDQD